MEHNSGEQVGLHLAPDHETHEGAILSFVFENGESISVYLSNLDLAHTAAAEMGRIGIHNVEVRRADIAGRN